MAQRAVGGSSLWEAVRNASAREEAAERERRKMRKKKQKEDDAAAATGAILYFFEFVGGDESSLPSFSPVNTPNSSFLSPSQRELGSMKLKQTERDDRNEQQPRREQASMRTKTLLLLLFRPRP